MVHKSMNGLIFFLFLYYFLSMLCKLFSSDGKPWVNKVIVIIIIIIIIIFVYFHHSQISLNYR